MAKIDKSNLTKEQAVKLMAARRLEKKKKQIEQTTVVQSSKINPDVKHFVLCVKVGTKYSHEYVNTLYNMVQRNCTKKYQFACITDDPDGLYDDIIVIPPPPGPAYVGWWVKPYMFSDDLPIKGDILYLDLDVVIAGNIDKLFDYQPNVWCVVRDFTRAMRPSWDKCNSSVVRFKTGQLKHVWDEYAKDPKDVQRRFFGDQDWLHDATKKQRGFFFPDSWVLSWKWEVRQSREYAPGGLKGNRVLKNIENVTPRIECCICVFHGDPNPEKCKDPWVVDNWK